MTNAARPPWHFWLVALLGAPWNAFGAYDYWMSQTAGRAYYREVGMTDAQIAYMDAYPGWITAVWAIGVWGAVLGALLLLMRLKIAVPVFMVSLAAYLMSLIYTYLLSEGAAVMGDAGAMQFVILIGCVFFVVYSWQQARRGVLR